MSSRPNRQNCGAPSRSAHSSRCVAAAGGWIVGQQTLKPLAARWPVRRRRSPSAIRLDATRAPNSRDELGQFAPAFNELLDRLAGVLHAQRQFMADASHELRTTVSVVRTTAQVTMARTARSEDDYRESSRSSPSRQRDWRGWLTRCSCCRGRRRTGCRSCLNRSTSTTSSRDVSGRCVSSPRSAASTLM